MFECGDCGKAFPAGWRARNQHCDATGHSPPEYECDTCDACFSSDHARWQHMRAKGHFSQDESSSDGDCYGYWECSRCDDTFVTEEDCKEHMVDDHLYCRDCDRSFVSHNNIKQHLNSKTHRGSTMECPFCSATYTTATGMTHHLERGSCPRAPNLGRNELFQLVRSRDPNGIISKHSIRPSTITYTADPETWNGYVYKCPLCPRVFSLLRGLNQHLNSPAHQEVLYHCPKSSCFSEFKTLAAIINHLESETCGAMRFDTVQRRIGDIVSGNRLLRF